MNPPSKYSLIAVVTVFGLCFIFSISGLMLKVLLQSPQIKAIYYPGLVFPNTKYLMYDD